MMLLVEFFSEPFWCRLCMTLAHFLWQGATVAILICAIIGFFRVERANARYVAYLLAFAAMTICPIATFIVLEAPAKPTIAPIKMMEFTRVRPIAEKGPSASDISSAGDIPSGTTRAVSSIDSMSARRKISDYVYMFVPPALVVWLTGVLVLSVRLLLGLIGVSRWRRNAEPLPATLAGRVGSLCKRLGMEDFSHVYVSPSAIQAMAVGYLRPMILVPAALVTQMQPEMLEAVIAHELAHIRRFDLWVNLWQRVVETLLFFHPAVWWLSHRIEEERELCCDDLAVKATGERVIYAAALERAALAVFALRRPALAAGFGSGKKPILNRVRHVLGLAPAPSGVRSWLAGIATITFILALAVSFVLIRRAEAAGSTAVSTSAPLLAWGESNSDTRIADRFNVRFDSAKWATLIPSARTKAGRREEAAERLRLYADVSILDPQLVLGISMQGTIAQFETGKGETIGVDDRGLAGPYMAPRYRRRFVMPPKPAKWKMAVRSILRLPPPKTPRPQRVFELGESRVRLELDSELIAHEVDKISRVKGYFYVLMAESLEHVDVPFEPSKKWVRLTPDLEVRVLEAESDNSRYEYDIETRQDKGAAGKYPPRPDSILPDRLATGRLLIGEDGEPIRPSRFGFLKSSVGGRGSGAGSNLGIVEKIRFVIAVNPSHFRVPFELENITMPEREAGGDGAPNRLAARSGRTANSSGPAAPDLSDGAILRKKWVNLSWKPDSDALSYNVYLGDSLEGVNDGDADTFRGNQKGTHLIVGFPGFAYPEGLAPGTTYFWRVDRINEADPDKPLKGDVRSFSVAPKTASNPVPADGAESVASNAELSWTAGFGAKLHWVYFGDDLDTVANASGGRPQPENTFTPPALIPGTTYYWRVDEFDPPNTSIGDVWSFTVRGGAE